jgi:hypothetical protein
VPETNGASHNRKAAMTQLGGNALLGGIIIQLVPLYLILQIWLGYTWTGRWRVAALLPLIGFVPALIFALVALSHDSNLWPLTVIFFAPVGLIYLLVVAIARAIVNRRRTT